jgi:putative intracellular protease/amidase
VMPDLAIADADASRYDAIMFSGGWGSSMYQYAFQGSYSNRGYDGDRQTKAAVNKLLNEFIKQDKYVGALCHGVSVLAWARVDGKSVLNGKRAVGSPRESPSGVYNGQRGQPLSRWNAEVNGARLSPARSIGNPNTSADDVVVDGKVITGEDDNSSAVFGATLAKLLIDSAH